MKKGILSEISVNRQQNKAAPIKQTSSKAFQKTAITPQVHKAAQQKIGAKQNLMVNCNDDDGFDLTKFDSNTCIDQGNDSKYENYMNDQQEFDIIKNRDFLGMNSNNNNQQKGNFYEYSFHNKNSSNFLTIPDILKNETESSSNINKTFSIMDSVYDDDQSMKPRSINKETVNEIMKTMPKSAQQILQRIMGRNTEDGSKITLNPSQNEDFEDEISGNISSLTSILQSSSKKAKDQSHHVLSYSQLNDDSYLQNICKIDTPSLNSHISNTSNRRQNNNQAQKENQKQTTYLKVLQERQQSQNGLKRNASNLSTASRTNIKKEAVIEQNQIFDQQKSNKSVKSQPKQIGAVKQIHQPQGQNLQKMQELIQQSKGNSQPNQYNINYNYDDFSFELENMQNRDFVKNYLSEQQRFLGQANNNNSLHPQNTYLQETYDGFLGGLPNENNFDEFIEDEKLQYQSSNNYQSNQPNNNQLFSSASQRNISPASYLKQKNNSYSRQSMSKQKISNSKEKLQTPSEMKLNSKTRNNQFNKSPNSQKIATNEITFSLERNINNLKSVSALGACPSTTSRKAINKNQQFDLIDKKPHLKKPTRSISPQLKRSESAGANKNHQQTKVIERCASSLSQQNNKSNDRSHSSLRDGGLSAKSAQSGVQKQNNLSATTTTSSNNNSKVLTYINRIKNSNSSSSNVSNQNPQLNPKSSDIFFGEQQPQNKQITTTKNNKKSVTKLTTGKQHQQLQQLLQIGSSNERAQSQDNQNRGRNSKTSNILERARSQLNIERLDTCSSTNTQRISPTFTTLSITSNSKRNVKSPSKASLFSNLDKILKEGRTKSPSNEKITFDKKVPSSYEAFKKIENQKLAIQSKNIGQKNSTVGGTSSSIKSLIRTGRGSSYFTERTDKKSPLRSSKEEKYSSCNQGLSLHQENEAQENKFEEKGDQQDMQKFNSIAQAPSSDLFDQYLENSSNSSLSNQLAFLMAQNEQPQKIMNHGKVDNQFLHNLELNLNCPSNNYLNSFSSNQITRNINTEVNNFSSKQQYFHGGSFFNENSFGKQDQLLSDLPLQYNNNLHNNPESNAGFSSHISSICQDSYRNYENLEPRVVDQTTVNEIMKSMPQSAQQILQKIMSRGNMEANQVMINPTQLQNNSLPLNFSFDIEQEISAYQKAAAELELKKMTSSIIPQQDPGSIREEEELGEDHICKQSNSTDIEILVKQLNFENNSSSFASSSNGKRGRSSSLSKSFSSTSKDKVMLQNSQFLLNGNNLNDFHLTEDDLKLDARLQSLDKMINLSDNVTKIEKGNKFSSNNNKNVNQKGKLNYSYSSKSKVQQQSVNNSLSVHSAKNKVLQDSMQLNNSIGKSNKHQMQYTNSNKNLTQEFDEFSMNNLTIEQIQMLEEISKQQLIEIEKKQLNQSQQSIKYGSSSKSNKSKSIINKTALQDVDHNETAQKSLQQANLAKPSLVINPPIPKQFQNIVKQTNLAGNNSSMCSASQQSQESFYSSSTKPISTSNAAYSSTSKKQISYYSNQKKSQKLASSKTYDKLNHSNQSTQQSSQIIQQNSHLKYGSKSITEDSLAIDKSDYLLQSNSLNSGISQQSQLLIFKPQFNSQFNQSISKNLNNSSDRIKKLNETLSNISSQLTQNQPQQQGERAHSLQNQKADNLIYTKVLSQRSALNESPNTKQYSSISCTSLSAIPNISTNSVLNRSFRDLQTGNLQEHEKEICASGIDNSYRSLSSVSRDDNPERRITRSNTCNIVSSSPVYVQEKKGVQKRQLEDLQLTVNEKEAEIISLKLQVQDLQEVLEKQKFLQSSNKKKRYNDLEEKIISSRINIGSAQIPNQSGSTKSVNSVKTDYSSKNEMSEQKFCETYPKNLNFINCNLKRNIDIPNEQASAARSIQNQPLSSCKKDYTLSSRLDETEGSHLKLNASEIDLTYQINQFTINKNINQLITEEKSKSSDQQFKA